MRFVDTHIPGESGMIFITEWKYVCRVVFWGQSLGGAASGGRRSWSQCALTELMPYLTAPQVVAASSFAKHAIEIGRTVWDFGVRDLGLVLSSKFVSMANDNSLCDWVTRQIQCGNFPISFNPALA